MTIITMRPSASGPYGNKCHKTSCQVNILDHLQLSYFVFISLSNVVDVRDTQRQWQLTMPIPLGATFDSTSPLLVNASSSIIMVFTDILSYVDLIPLPHLDRTNIYEFSKACLADPWMKDLVGQWADGLKGQFYGITTDGTRVEGLYELQDEGAPTEAAVS